MTQATEQKSVTYHVTITLAEPEDAGELWLPDADAIQNVLAHSTMGEALAEATGCDVTITLDD